MKKISVCIPCFNEEKNVENAYKRITQALQKQSDYDYEIIFSDNASTDGTVEEIKKIAERDDKVKGIVNSRNYGPNRSIKNCMFAATGDAIIEIFCDLQDPPELIPEFIRLWENGNKVVWGQKKTSSESKVKFLLRSIYYKIMKLLSESEQLEHVTGFGIMDKTVIEEIRQTEERDLSIRYIVTDLGFPVTLVPYNQEKRQAGKSSYNIGRYWSWVMSSLVRTSKVPLKIATILGIISAFVSFVIGIIYLIYKLIHWNTFVAGMAPLVVAIFFIGAIQLTFIGIIGEYIGAILDRVTKRPYVIEKERINFEKK